MSYNYKSGYTLAMEIKKLQSKLNTNKYIVGCNGCIYSLNTNNKHTLYTTYSLSFDHKEQSKLNSIIQELKALAL
jgi:hypothetical protein